MKSDFFDLSLVEYTREIEPRAAAVKFLEIESAGNKRECYWTLKNYEDHIRSTDRIFGWKQDGQIEGFLFYKIILNELEVIHWSVRQKKKGNGKKFFKEFLQQVGNRATTIHLECGENNEGAMKIYTYFNFEKKGIRPGYYHSGESAWIMGRELGS